MACSAHSVGISRCAVGDRKIVRFEVPHHDSAIIFAQDQEEVVAEVGQRAVVRRVVVYKDCHSDRVGNRECQFADDLDERRIVNGRHCDKILIRSKVHNFILIAQAIEIEIRMEHTCIVNPSGY